MKLSATHRYLAVALGLFALTAFGAASPQSDKEKPSADKTTASKKAPPLPKGDTKRGKDVFVEWCQICHYETNTEKKIGPGLKGIYKRGKFEDGRAVNDTSMRKWIEDGGKDMPAFVDSLTAAQIADLMAYLRTL